MARTTIPVTELAAYGGVDDDLAYTAGDAVNDHDIVHPGTGDIYLIMKNASGSGKTATLVSAASNRTFNRTGDVTLSPSAGEESIVAIPPQGFIQASDSRVHIDIADATSVSFACYRALPTP